MGRVQLTSHICALRTSKLLSKTSNGAKTPIGWIKIFSRPHVAFGPLKLGTLLQVASLYVGKTRGQFYRCNWGAFSICSLKECKFPGKQQFFLFFSTKEAIDQINMKPSCSNLCQAFKHQFWQTSSQTRTHSLAASKLVKTFQTYENTVRQQVFIVYSC